MHTKNVNECREIDIIGDKSDYWQILLSNTTRLQCKQWQLRISPESSISLTLLYTQLLSVPSISLFYSTFTRKQNYTLEEYIRRGTTLIVKKKRACCNGNSVYISQAARELVQESGGERRSYNIPLSL